MGTKKNVLNKLRWGVIISAAGLVVIWELIRGFFLSRYISLSVEPFINIAIAIVVAFLVSSGALEFIRKIQQEIALQNKELLIMNTIVATINRSLDLKEILSTALDKILDLMGIEAGGIYLIDEEQQELVFTVHRGVSREFAQQVTRIKMGEGFTGKAAQSGKPVLLVNISDDPRLTIKAVRKERLKSFIVIPLKSKGKVLGVLNVASRKPSCFSVQDIELLTSVGNQISIAIENALLYKESEDRKQMLEQQVDKISSLYKTSITLNSILDLKALLPQVVKLAATSIGADNGALLLTNEESQRLAFEATYGLSRETIALASSQLNLKIGENEGLVGQVAKTREPLYIPDVTKSPLWQLLGEKENIQSFLCVPLKRGEKILGVFSLGSSRIDAFSYEDFELLIMFANQAAIAIENAGLFEEIKNLSLTDPLTGLANRRHLELALENELKRSDRYSRPFSLIMLDFDRFKRYNDIYGHQAGDEVLKRFGKILREGVRDVDLAARYGGEEFIVVLPETVAEGARIVAEKLRLLVQKEKFVGKNERIRLTISSGIATYPLHATNKEELIAAADKALYLAKQRGGNRVCIFQEI